MYRPGTYKLLSYIAVCATKHIKTVGSVTHQSFLSLAYVGLYKD